MKLNIGNILLLASKNKKSLKKTIFVILVFLTLIMIYINSSRAFEYKTDKHYSIEAYQLKPNKKLEQYISGIQGKLKGFTVQFGTYRRINDGTVNVNFYRNNELVQKWELEAENLIDNAYHDFLLDKPIMTSSQDEFSILINEEFQGENEVAVWTYLGGNQLFFDNSVLINRTISYQLILENTYAQYITIIGLIVIIMLLIIIIKKIDFEKINIFKWILLQTKFI